MRLLEYEAKQILREAGIPVPRSEIISKEKSPTFFPVVLKSQVPIGGRGKAGGIKIIKEESKLAPGIKEMFELSIKGFLPKLLLAEEPLAIQSEYYLSFIINRPEAVVQIMAHKKGGIEVEENSPESFLIFSVDSKSSEVAGERLAEFYELPDQSFFLQDLVKSIFHCFIQSDATLIEINPLIYTADKKLVAGDCKMELDDAAAFRHPEWNFENASKNSNFVTLNRDGNVATIANGAGLAMATVDAVTDYGLKPANFLDIGGGANSESVMAAFQKIMEYPNIKAIVINIFAGITHCDEVAKAIITAGEKIDRLPPLYIRLSGTNVGAAKDLLDAHRISLLPDLESCLVAMREELGSV